MTPNYKEGRILYVLHWDYSCSQVWPMFVSYSYALCVQLKKCYSKGLFSQSISSGV